MSPSLMLTFLLIAGALTQELPTPSALLKPNYFNQHALNSRQFLEEVKLPRTVKQGPVLFPNDGPPPPRPPLIVTSRPLIESISRSELGENNSIPASTQVRNFIKPFLARVKEYKPFHYPIATEAPYYEGHSPLPPIYKAFADHAKQKVDELRKQKSYKNNYDYQVPQYNHQYRPRQNTRNHNDDYGDEQSKNYAFSYAVKDKDTGDDFSHRQHSSGSATKGEYRVRLPDGRMQIVSYKADENGYQADVRYDDDKTTGNRIDDHLSDNHNNFNENKVNYVTDNSHIYNKNDYSRDQYNVNVKSNHDYQQLIPYKPDDTQKYVTPTADYYNNQYPDLSKEYYTDDLSSEFESKNYEYEPHQNKFSSLINNDNYNDFNGKSNLASGSTVTPTYEDLKDLLVTKKAYNTVQPFYNNVPFEIKVPSTTPSTYDVTTERVVLIGGKRPNLYTSVSSTISPINPTILPVTSSPLSYNNYVSSTPESYLVSTINNLRNNANNVDFSGPKPVLSKNYIERINKYLRYK